jgi:hypothetical protein
MIQLTVFRVGLSVLLSVFGFLACPGPQREWVAEMAGGCGGGAPTTCSEICEGVDMTCTASDGWEECPADAWGLDLGQCEDGLEGVPLDVKCDDPLDYVGTDPIGGFESYRCCCKSIDVVD